jgi:hypothetical protein
VENGVWRIKIDISTLVQQYRNIFTVIREWNQFEINVRGQIIGGCLIMPFNWMSFTALNGKVHAHFGFERMCTEGVLIYRVSRVLWEKLRLLKIASPNIYDSSLGPRCVLRWKTVISTLRIRQTWYNCIDT